MKTKLQYRSSPSGFMLIEAIAYIAIFALVLGVGTSLLYRGWAANIALRKNADDIARTLNAGELWRADIHSAKGPVTGSSGQEMHIPNGSGEIVYRFAEGSVTRIAPGQQPRILAGIKSSDMQVDHRLDATGWRWELELNHDRKKVQFRPLFTFEAVAKDKPSK